MKPHASVRDGGHERERLAMVRDQLVARGIKDERVLQAMGRVPREHFVDPSLAARAYEDHPLPIGSGQTISQPYMVARTVELLALQGDERVLDVGVGSGYQAAVLAALVPRGKVYGIERLPELSASAAARLKALGYDVEVRCGDGTQGWWEHAPFDAIAVAAGAPKVPAPLLAQLADGGRLVLPVGDHEEQRLLLIRRRGEDFVTEADIPCMYVDLIGEDGW
jgi:protein-L-isoaspartate(D-aspartate) O-methyltransferase